MLICLPNCAFSLLAFLPCVLKDLRIYLDMFYFQLEHGAKPCIKCNHGYYPIHAAARSAAAKTLEVIIKYGTIYSFISIVNHQGCF